MEEKEGVFEAVTVEEYRVAIMEIVNGIEDVDLLEYLHIFCKGKADWYYKN